MGSLNKKQQRILVVSDFHCGHRNGLKIGKSKHWEFFEKEVNQLKPIDICIANGDLIEGKGEKTGGTELITADRNEQVKIAIEILEFINAKRFIFTYGTFYHAGREEDWEEQIAKHFNSSIASQQFLEVNGLMFHVKHRISQSSIPHGRFTPLARQKLWNLFWAENGEVPRVNIFIRSHVHYFDFCGGKNWFAVITPALQGWGSKFGERYCEGTIDFGFIHFDIINKDNWVWKAHLAAVESVSIHRF